MAYTTVIPQQVRQPNSYDSPSQKLASTVNQFWVQAIMNAADLTDPTKSLTVQVWKSLDGVQWFANPTVTLEWKGSAGNTKPAGFVIDGPAGGPPFWVKATLVLNAVMNLGLQVQTT
jgi:hypothetical protein